MPAARAVTAGFSAGTPPAPQAAQGRVPPLPAPEDFPATMMVRPKATGIPVRAVTPSAAASEAQLRELEALRARLREAAPSRPQRAVRPPARHEQRHLEHDSDFAPTDFMDIPPTMVVPRHSNFGRAATRF